jgi:hypothetical protein
MPPPYPPLRLLLDYRFRFLHSPKEAADNDLMWSHRWDSISDECTTLLNPPQANEKEGGCTMFFNINNQDMPGVDCLNGCFDDFFNDRETCDLQGGNIKFSFKKHTDISYNVTATQRGRTIWRGFLMATASADVTKDMDSNIGNYVMLHSCNVQGNVAMRDVHAAAFHGDCAIIPHVRTEIDLEHDIGQTLKLVTVTGLDETNIRLATRFTLINTSSNNEEVARCHMSYKDASYEPSVGPTIELMEARRDYRGRSLVPLLWYFVRYFVEENFTIECIRSEVPAQHVMIKATKLANTIIDTKPVEAATSHGNIADAELEPLTDKTFFYEYTGFSIRLQRGEKAASMDALYPADEEAVLFIPLPSRQELAARSPLPVPPEALQWTTNLGKRLCDACGKMQIDVRVCGRCKHTHYCSTACLRGDWKPRHKFLCKKTQEEVEELLLQKGLLRRLPDGSLIAAIRVIGGASGFHSPQIALSS